MSPTRLEVHPRAVAEARAARRWYARRSAAVANRFVAELDRGDADRVGATALAALPAQNPGLPPSPVPLFGRLSRVGRVRAGPRGGPHRTQAGLPAEAVALARQFVLQIDAITSTPAPTAAWPARRPI